MAVQALVERLEDDVRPVAADEVHRSQPWLSRRTRWLVGFTATALAVAAVCSLVVDEVQQRERFDQARTSLGVSRQILATVSTQLSTLTHDLNVLTIQVGSDTTASNLDASQLKGAQTALLAAAAHVSQQASEISSLHTCLSGVEQALNTLSVGNQALALNLLSSVSSSCSSAAAASG